MGNLTFSLGTGKDAGGSWQRLRKARPQLGVKESGFRENSLARSTWDCQKDKAQSLERGEEAPDLDREGVSQTTLLMPLRGQFKLSWSLPFLVTSTQRQGEESKAQRPAQPSAGPAEPSSSCRA